MNWETSADRLLRNAVGWLLRVFLAAGGIAFMLLVAAWGVSSRLRTEPAVYDPKEVQAAEELRETPLDPGHPVQFVQEVDYSQGRSAPWYPKGESPILADLVRQGKLPPVAERVGEEPVVVEGVEGIGKYGGTWMRVSNSDADVDLIKSRMAGATLVRWSPKGYPIVPHLAKRYEVSPDNREFTFYLRKGVKWSDGYPFTANDILFWWEHEVTDKDIRGTLPPYMLIHGKPGRVEKVDDYCVKFIFPEPYGLFLARMAGPEGQDPVGTPEHFMRKLHPTLGDVKLIEETMREAKIRSRGQNYLNAKVWNNPQHPRLWPWLYRTWRASSPQTCERNPYYFVVDTQGNQLPYIDRVLFEVVQPDMLPLKVAGGEVSMQERNIEYDNYTFFMSQRSKGDYEVYHWYPGDRSSFLVSVNLNRRIDPARPETSKKNELLNDKRFRQALSLAVNRDEIIEAQFNGMTQPVQLAPGEASPFYYPPLQHAFTEYDPVRANQLLDEIGLTQRDYEGYRTFKDGSRMSFFLDHCEFTSREPVPFLIDHWGAVGVRVLDRERARSLFYTAKTAREHELSVFIGAAEFMPLLDPRYFVPCNPESNFALGYAKWYQRGGLYGDELSKGVGCIEPPLNHPARKAMEFYEEACAYSDVATQSAVFQKVLDIAAENVWTINISSPPPALVVVKNGFRNVPRVAVTTWMFLTPANAGVETYFFDHPHDSPGALAEMKQSILAPTLAPRTVVVPGGQVEANAGANRTSLMRWIWRGVLLITTLWILSLGFRYPYIGRRLVLMIPTLLIISVISFTIIQLPPGDYLTARIMQLEEQGDSVDLQTIEDLRKMFWLDDPVTLQYARWLGLAWFVSFDQRDTGLLQGNLGISMATGTKVNDTVGDRILLTVLLSLGTILFTWATALPIGIYSAVRQYSLGDYILTFIGFIGMCVPSFLLALILMYVSGEFLNIPVSGLFSSRYGAQPEWTWGKVADLLKHLWVPVTVLGIGGTAGMIRVMRANLLDELKLPYVITAKAKGVRPIKVLLKYPVRIALNPFISGIGGLFPALVSGGTIVSIVLSLPTIGPLMLTALMTEDMYLAGSMLMVLSLLSVLGTLVSDLLLLWLDPRIRFQGGTR